jgi:hypothetical protein
MKNKIYHNGRNSYKNPIKTIVETQDQLPGVIDVEYKFDISLSLLLRVAYRTHWYISIYHIVFCSGTNVDSKEVLYDNYEESGI